MGTRLAPPAYRGGEPREQPGNQVRGRSRSLEVRWFVPGQLATVVAEWFARFPVEIESREDTYLLHPLLPRVSVKLRGGRGLDVKVYRGSPGVLDVPDRARGRIECWQKWPLSADSLSRVSADLARWAAVRKRRRISWFPPPGGPARPRGPGPGVRSACAVELTEVQVRGESWWSLGFEAIGPVGTLHSELRAAAALVFTPALPGGVKFRLDGSCSYAEWLCQRLAGPLSTRRSR